MSCSHSSANFTPEEIRPSPWAARANEAGVSIEEFFHVAEELNARKIIGRFFNFPGAHQAISRRCSCHAVQRIVSLGRSRGP